MPHKRQSFKLDDPLLKFAGTITLLLLFLPWLWKAVLVAVLMTGATLYIAIYRRRMRWLQATGIGAIDQMDGRAFEQRLWMLFRQLGYEVEQTPYSGDWGADLIIFKGGSCTVVQAKRYSKPVGPAAVQEAMAAKAKYGCDGALVVTNNRFTRAAQELAWANRVRLWDREQLIEELHHCQSLEASG